jgi:hypothetical protein
MNRPANLSLPDKSTDLSPVATNCAGISFDTGTKNWATVSGSITGNMTGGLTCNKIVRLEIGGTLSAPLAAKGTGEALGRLELGASTSAGTLDVTPGFIHTIVGTSGTIQGAIDAGFITSIDTVGSISIATGGITADDGIESIIAAGDIDADINANTANHTSGTDGAIQYIECDGLAGTVAGRNLGVVADAGDYDSVVAGAVTAPMTFTGDVFGKIVVDSFGTGADITIGGDLRASVLAIGDIQAINIDGMVQPVTAPIVIESSTGAIGSIDVANEFQSDTEGGIVINAAEGVGAISCAGMYCTQVGPQSFPRHRDVAGFAHGRRDCDGFFDTLIHICKHRHR